MEEEEIQKAVHAIHAIGVERAVNKLVEKTLEEAGRVVKVSRADDGWAAQIEPWEEIKMKRKRTRWGLRRLPPIPPVIYEVDIDKNFDVTSCHGGKEPAVTERVANQLSSAVEQGIKQPLRKQEGKEKPSPFEGERPIWEQEGAVELMEDALGEVGRVVRLDRVDGGWAVQIEPWEEAKWRRKRTPRYIPRRIRIPPIIHEVKLDQDFNITSYTDGEDPAVTERVISQLRAAIDQKVKQPIQKRKEREEEEIGKERVMPAELEREYVEAKQREEWARTASFLKNDQLELILFGGKGGTGKTTSAASSALRLARLHPQKKILIVSIDPAHSLGDSFDCVLGSEPMPVKGMDNLWAAELDAPKLHDEFRERHNPAMKTITYRGSIFDPGDVEDIFAQAIPGMDELMAIIEIANIRQGGKFDLTILDTAPTGHTLRLLALPDLMLRWMRVFDLMQAKHRYLSRHLSGHYHKDEGDRFIDLMVRDISTVKWMLSNTRITEFVPVTIPEPMSISETERFVETLKSYDIPVRSIIVNRLARGDGCVFCQSRRRDQEGHVAEIDESFGSYNLFRMPLFPHEIRGVDGLTEYGDILSGKAYEYVPPAAEPLPEVAPTPPAPMADLLERDLRFILFSGKGGVGKTSTAASTALALAKRNPSKDVLAFSMDPAHSLSDAFGCPIGDQVAPIPGVDNLYGIEIDPDKLWEEFKADYRDDMNVVIERLMGGTSGSNIQFDREAASEVIELSPPGLNEIMALEKLMDFYEEGAYDLYVVDTAATGHLIRFLELPDLLIKWMQVLIKLLLKYRRVLNLADLPKAGWRLLRTSRHVKQIRDAFTDPKRAEFMAITIPEAMGVLETNDLLATLAKLKMPCRYIVMNMMVPPTECGFCASKRKEQQKYVQQMHDTKPAECEIAQLPLFPHQIKGMEALTDLSEQMYGK